LVGYWAIKAYQPETANKQENKTTSNVSSKEVIKGKKVIHVVAMGDMLAHDTIIANAKTSDGYDFSQYFASIRSSYSSADLIFCNQEGLSSGESYGISGYPTFNAPTQFAAGLQSGAGCNFINLANNHMGDKGAAAISSTLDVWANLKPLAVSGANKNADDQNKVSYATINGIKIGFLAFADFSNNSSIPSYCVNNYHDEELVRKLVDEARKNSDVVMVSMHWGIEDSNEVSGDQQAQTSLLSSLGVDLIIGTGPHVLQKVQTINRTDGGKTVVWYSLGNMLSSQLKIQELIGGIALFDITKDINGKVSVSGLSFIPTYMHYEWTADQAAKSDLLARKNAKIYLLSEAAEPMSRSLFNTNVSEQKKYVINTLGGEVNVK
jgi:poly-gamma-glutamate synthesis protein (capsule biosynthesis protein)